MATKPTRRQPSVKPDKARIESESDLQRAMRAQETDSNEPEDREDTREAESEGEDEMYDARSSRDQETRDAEQFYEGEDFDISWLERPNLTAPEARPGMVQRWVATTVMGQSVPAHATRQWRQGWRPRSPETVQSQSFPNFLTSDGDGYIGYAGLVLMERPIAVARKARELNQQKVRDQHASIEGDLRKEEVPGQPFMIEHRSRVTNRPVAVEEEF